MYICNADFLAPRFVTCQTLCDRERYGRLPTGRRVRITFGDGPVLSTAPLDDDQPVGACVDGGRAAQRCRSEKLNPFYYYYVLACTRLDLFPSRLRAGCSRSLYLQTETALASIGSSHNVRSTDQAPRGCPLPCPMAPRVPECAGLGARARTRRKT